MSPRRKNTLPITHDAEVVGMHRHEIPSRRSQSQRPEYLALQAHFEHKRAERVLATVAEEPLPEVHAGNWRDFALCMDEDPELFFPIGETGPAALQIQEAKKVCNRCKAAEFCLKWAIEMKQTDGVWGGTSEHDRKTVDERALFAQIRNDYEYEN